jgi:hypothetical protein
MREVRPVSEEEVAGALRRLTQVTERSRERRAHRERIWAGMAGLTTTEAGVGGAVRVTIGTGGELTGLDLAESVRSLPSAVLSAQIMAAVRRAQATLARQVTALADDPGAEPDPMVAGIVARYRSQFPEQPADTGPPPVPPPPMLTPPPRVAPRQPPPASPRPPRPVYQDDDDFSQETFLRRQ